MNELKQPKLTTKTVQKSSTGGSKRTRPLHELSAPQNDRDSQFSTSPGVSRESHIITHYLNSRDTKLKSKVISDIHNVYNFIVEIGYHINTLKKLKLFQEEAYASLSANDNNTQDLNLANSKQRTNSKSSSKLFEDLKENVYLEV